MIGLIGVLIPQLVFAQAEGILDVKCNVDGAVVFVDGELLGEAPIVEIIAAGPHKIEVQREAFATHKESINLPADATVEVIATLQRVLPGLEVETDVATARILLDGEEIGQGSTILDPVEPGSHTLVVEGGEFGRYEGKIELPEVRMTPVRVMLRGSLGTLTVNTTPEGASVAVDGRSYGQTPATIDPIQPGQRGVRITKDGHSEVIQSVQIEEGVPTAIDVTLVPEGGMLEIKPSPRDAMVYVNGVQLGEGKQVLGPLKPGTYSIRATYPGHADFVQPAVVDASGKTRVAARLQSFNLSGGVAQATTKPVHQRPGFWAGIGGGAAAVAAGIIITAVAVNQTTDPGPTIIPGTDPPSTTYTWALP
ncbi:MAG: PEGA domain-containing protein [Proteobacteria bacterium]|nr:PEGA domain-containing protein [Pseudomonadota bacterium]